MKIITILCIATLFLGCGSHSIPETRLPLVQVRWRCVDYSPLMLEISLDAAGGMRIQDKSITLQDLKNLVESRIARYGAQPVALRADRKRLCGDILNTLQCLVDIGVSQTSFAVFQKKNKQTHYIDFRLAPPTDGGTVMIIDLKRREIHLDGKTLSDEDMRKTIARVALFTRDIDVVIVPDMDKDIQQLVDVLDVCEIEGLMRTHVLRTMPAQ